MDQTIRNKLRGVVTQCRKLLEDSTAQALQGRFGIYAARKKGEVQIEDEARMAHLTEEDRACRQDLLDHLEHIQAIGYKPSEALEQLVREISFTHLNRLCAYKMMESRGLIREAVSRGLKSQGFFFYLSDHPEDEKLHNGGGQETAYRNFLDWLGGTLSQEIGVLFNPNDPANRIYPPQRLLEEVLALINDSDLKDIWSQDETIGWVYQYFTPKELRDKARKESRSPRNSYELAFRNQFFTPRYVVEFLTDNTLGRIWYEMRKGKTILKDRCKYLVRRPTEMFLKEGETPPAELKDVRENLSQEKLLKQPVYIPYRPKKDPRELKVLDPACGSGHFLLYCFDLLQVIYEEAYDDPDIGAALRKDYPAIEDLRRAVPALILKHNLHGIDIDLRATQIAALALWLRCQRAYQELGLKNGERPKITRSNIVCAEPMPGETDLLKEFTATLQPKVLGQLVETIFEKMKLVGEAGSLLKIEEEIRQAAAIVKKEYKNELLRRKQQEGFLPGMAPPRQPTLFDFADLTDEAFLDRGEEEIVEALRRYATQAENGTAYRKHLFAEDAERGFAFIDLCRKRFDVVLMNPPFGELTGRSKEYVETSYPSSKGNILAHFLERAAIWSQLQGKTGAIVSRTCFFLASLDALRSSVFTELLHLDVLADLGSGVLDAMVETASAVFSRTKPLSKDAVFFRLLNYDNKEHELLDCIDNTKNAATSINIFLNNPENFSILSACPYVYWITPTIIRKIANHPTLQPEACDIRVGLQTGDDNRFLRLWYEAPPELILCLPSSCRTMSIQHIQQICVELTKQGRPWAWYSKIDEASPFAAPIHLLVNWRDDGVEIRSFTDTSGSLKSRPQNIEFYFRPGISYMLRSSRLVPYIVPLGVIPTAGRSQIYPKQGKEHWILCIVASNVASAIARFRGENFAQPKFQNSMVASIPYIEGSREIVMACVQKLEEIIQSQRNTFKGIETCIEFVSIPKDLTFSQKNRLDRASLIGRELDLRIGLVFGFGNNDMDILERDLMDSVNSPAWVLEALGDDDSSEEEIDQHTGKEDFHAVNSYALGCSMGRWDIRFATGERQPPELPDPFDPLPVCPPGMLQGPDGLPAKPEDVPSDYPIRIDWDGILVDDPGHEDDIIRRVQNVLEVIWKDRAEAIEVEACEILGVRELRDYFRKPGNGGFWMDHVKRYSKSRRKAPIYWYLRSAKGNYGLWLYYHRLDKDILFKALLNYVEPKIRLEEDRLKTLRGRKEAAGSSGREAKQIEKDMDRQEQFVSELHDFADRLRRASNLHLEPDLNDGVVLNIAPLWELAPLKEANENWEELVEGKYEWSSIGKQMREKGLVKK